MERRRLAGFGLALGLVALSGCVQAPAPGVVAIADLPPPTVAVVPVAVVPPPQAAVWIAPPRRHVVAVHRVAPVHRVVATRHWVKRYHHAQAYYVPWTPQCGSDVRPCNPEHVETPFP